MIKAVKGTRDILPPASATWNRVEATARAIFQAYNYQEIRTPIFEETALFARGVGAETDIVSKEMYTFEDRDGSSLTLRPENTASVVRAYLEHRMDQMPGTKKLYYIGPMFRRERPQKGRYRQFFQIGAEALGSESPATDAEVIEMLVEILQACGVSGFGILINSVGCKECRPKFVAQLKQDLEGKASRLCGDCQRRAVTNPLRVLDCKVPEDQEIINTLPSILDHLCATCSAHFAAVQTYLTDREIPFSVRPRLVRGLDYYMRTTFEFTHGALGAQNSILGGGRYDGLAESLGAKVAAPGIGFSIGEDRLVMAVEEAQPEGFGQPPLDLFVAPMSEAAFRQGALVARTLRRAGKRVEVAAAGKVKRHFELANKAGARFVLLIGDDELASGQWALKNMTSGEQSSVNPAELLPLLA